LTRLDRWAHKDGVQRAQDSTRVPAGVPSRGGADVACRALVERPDNRRGYYDLSPRGRRAARRLNGEPSVNSDGRPATRRAAPEPGQRATAKRAGQRASDRTGPIGLARAVQDISALKPGERPPLIAPEAIATFPSMSSAFAVRVGDGALEVCAPYGFTDLLLMRTRSNLVLAPRQVYEAKTARWHAQ
jgi:hypothetical protein